MCSDPVTALRLDYKLSEAGAVCLAQLLRPWVPTQRMTVTLPPCQSPLLPLLHLSPVLQSLCPCLCTDSSLCQDTPPPGVGVPLLTR